MNPTVKHLLSARSEDELIEAATALAEADLRMRRALVEARRTAGMTQKDVAEALGIKQASVAAFERYDNDPRLSTIRRYALAVGAGVAHDVTARYSFDGEWRQMGTPGSAAVTPRPAGSSVSYVAVAADNKRVDFALAA
jgi:DNA-binding XRE family transcriptional regulator